MCMLDTATVKARKHNELNRMTATHYAHVEQTRLRRTNARRSIPPREE